MGNIHEQYCQLAEMETFSDKPSWGEMNVDEEKILKFVAPYEDEESSSFFINALDQLPSYLEKTKIYEQGNSYNSIIEKRRALIQSIIPKLLRLSTYKEKDKSWMQECLEQITNKANRAYINKNLIPFVRPNEKGKLYNSIRNFCIADLKERTASVPQPPPNWTRKVPKSTAESTAINSWFRGSRGGSTDWSILKDFLKSPTQKEFLYIQNADARSALESLIKDVEIDLKMETIKKGRPYTLKITKTQYAYEKALKHYKEDLKILKGFE